MLQVTKFNQESEIIDCEDESDRDEDNSDIDLDAFMIDDEYNNFNLDSVCFNEIRNFSDSESSEAEDSMDESSEASESESNSDTTESTEETPILLIAPPPKVLEPSHHIQKIQRMTSTAVPKGYRICGDNIDKTVRPRFMRSDRKNTSLHYFHAYAVQNRIDVSALSDSIESKTYNPESIANMIIPSMSDDKLLRENIAALISRVLVSNLSFFEFSFDKVVDWHIEHQFSLEMSQKSKVVSYYISREYDVHV